MSHLSCITGPESLRALDDGQLRELATELRSLLVGSVCRSGGHLGPNLGVVELTIALHRVFDSPRTPIVFDTGHQGYVHKLLTGRAGRFSTLRQAGGLSGYPNRGESVHDVVENSHASTALSYADGLSKAFELAGQDRTVVAVVGDGALTGGPAWEALNNLGAGKRRVVVVLNDNGRSYAPTVGGLAVHLARLRDRSGYERLLARLGGQSWEPSGGDTGNLFTAMGLGYLGPVDGHDLAALQVALTEANERTGPVVVHAVTRKGAGYLPAEADEADRLHTVGRVEVATGRPARRPARTWTDAFSDALLAVGETRPDVVAVSAAMIGPTGLGPFAERYPHRCFDTGIAEAHAVTSAAGLAMGGAHPVVALYATFAGRGFDQVLLDVGLHRLPVTLVLDRAGITGPDGPSHHGIWDLALLGLVPGIRLAAPRDAVTVAEELAEAVQVGTGPTALRFPKASVGPALAAVERWHGMDVLRADRDAAVLLVAIGATAAAAMQAADSLERLGVSTTVIDPRWVLPVNPALVSVAASHELVVTVEDGVRSGGVGTRLAQDVADAGCEVPICNLGLPSAFLPHGERGALLAEHGLDGPGLVGAVTAALGPVRRRSGRVPAPRRDGTAAGDPAVLSGRR